MTQDQEKLYYEMEKQLRWNPLDVATISAMADLLMETGDEDEADKLAEGKEAAEKVNEAKKLLHELTELYELKKTELELRIQSYRKSCPHPITEYNPDASGNNDWWDKCLCCGKEGKGIGK